jgi:demethylmenaquinone methyltransferase / 2-methoxy-6-polyprenyl-1,4-benzoquinol methylase
VNSPYVQQDPATIRQLFATIAKRYDLGNSLTSLGLHHFWNRALIRAALAVAPVGPLLDLCAGTGAIGLGYLRRSPSAAVTLLDFCPQMLAHARSRLPSGSSASFLEADAQSIPLPQGSVACVTTAYGIRNIADPSVCAAEVARILQPGGSWLILELTRPDRVWLRLFHRIYLRTMLPTIGGILTGNGAAYRYLAGSIYSFADLVTLVRPHFQLQKRRRLVGGIATLLHLKVL